jgi:hypothetical protein
MAKLISALKISGTVDDLSFCLQQDGSVVVQSKPGPRSEQVKAGKNFDLTRRNAREFGKATRDAMLLRHSLGYIAGALRHSKLNSHVNQRMHQVALSDTGSDYGSRHANKGQLPLLEGFDYNHLLSLETALPVRLKHSLNVATGVLQLVVPGCIVRRKKVFPAGATHFKIVSCAAALDFDKHRYSNHIAASDLQPLSKQMPGVELAHSLCAKPGQVMVHSVGIIFYKVQEGKTELLRGGALQLVEAVKLEQVIEVAERPVVSVLPGIETGGFQSEEGAIAVGLETNTLAVATVVHIAAIGKIRCSPCTLQHDGFLLPEEAPATTVIQAALPGIFENACPEADDFGLGITDALGVPLQDEAMQQIVIEHGKGPRKRSRLKGYLGRRLE